MDTIYNFGVQRLTVLNIKRGTILFPERRRYL